MGKQESEQVIDMGNIPVSQCLCFFLKKHIEAQWNESEGMLRRTGLTRQSLMLPWTRGGDSPRGHPSGGVLTFRKCYEIVFHDENILHELF